MDGKVGVPSVHNGTENIIDMHLHSKDIPVLNCTSFRSGADDDPLMTAVLNKLRVEPMGRMGHEVKLTSNGRSSPKAGRSTTLQSLR